MHPLNVNAAMDMRKVCQKYPINCTFFREGVKGTKNQGASQSFGAFLNASGILCQVRARRPRFQGEYAEIWDAPKNYGCIQKWRYGSFRYVALARWRASAAGVAG